MLGMTPSTDFNGETFSYTTYLTRLFKVEGPFALYKGLGSGLIGTVVSFGIYFFWYRFFKNLWYHFFKRELLSDLDITAITVLSGVINSLCTNPIWFINTRMSLAKEKKSILKTVADIYKAEGITAFYKGVLPNILLVTNPVINFVIYENLKKVLLAKGYNLHWVQLFAISSLAKSIATLATYPVLTVRVLLQTSNDKDRLGLLRFIWQIVKENGLGLYRGFYAKLFQTVLYNAFLMITYEKLKRFIKYLLLVYLRGRHIIKE